MNKICTSIEQSKKLIELGIDVNTADLWYIPIKVNGVSGYELTLHNSLTRGIVPAWSLTALLELMPKIGANEPKLCKRYYIYAPLIRYVCIYGLLKDTKEYDNPIDAVFEMIIWLKEIGKI